MSAAAYGGNSEADNYLASQGYSKDEDLTGSGFSWERFLTEGPNAIINRNRPNATVYSKDGKATIAYRGTDLWHLNTSDLLADAAITLGINDVSRRFTEAEDLYGRTVAKYGEGNVSVTGHSLGGSEALYVARNHHIGGTVFNPGQIFTGDYAAEQFAKTFEGANKSSVTTVLPVDRWQTHLPDRYKWGADAISVSSEIFPEKRVYVERKPTSFLGFLTSRSGIGFADVHGVDQYLHPPKSTMHFDLDNPSNNSVRDFDDNSENEMEKELD